MKWQSFSWIFLGVFFFLDRPIAEGLTKWCPEWLIAYAKNASLCINPGWICSSCILVTLILTAFDYKLQRSWIKSCAILGFGLVFIRLAKTCIGRSRPKMWLKHHIYTCNFFTFDSHYLSFPSSHAYVAFAVAMILSNRFPKWRSSIFLISALLSCSRIILHQHFLTDVAGSYFIAFIMYALIWKTKIGQALESLPDRIIEKNA